LPGALDNPFLRQGDDGAALPLPAFDPAGGRLVMATDGHVISPLFFPGGDIGCLAVHGTVNDVAMMGATPLYLSASFIIEEGFPLADLQRIVESMGNASREAGRAQSSPATPRWWKKARAMVCSSAPPGLGGARLACPLTGANAQPGRRSVVSGTIGRPRRGRAVAARVTGSLKPPSKSDTAALHTLVAGHAGSRYPIQAVHVLRDPTRGGLATTLNEIARSLAVGMRCRKRPFPVLPQVEAACELLGLDPLYVANEGKLVAIVAPEAADSLLAAMRAHPLGAAMPHALAWSRRRFAAPFCADGHPLWWPANAVVDWLSGEQLPRIRAARSIAD
jgi:hydrogenase expression/formation protein HypE